MPHAMVYQGSCPEAALPPAVAGPAFLSDGTEVWVRPVQESDRDIVLDALERESPQVLGLVSLKPTLTQEEVLAPTSPDDRLCLLVLGERTDRVTVMGVGEYARTHPGSPVARVAFLVGGPFRDQGIATLLLARLARAAIAFGIRRFEARFREESPELLEVFRGSGLPVSRENAGGEVDVQIPLTPDVGATATRPVGRSPVRGGPGSASRRHRGISVPARRHRPPAQKSRL